MDAKQRLIDVLSVVTTWGHEVAMINYIKKFCKANNIEHYVDGSGNVYATKGVAEYYPCVVAHTDTVHDIDKIFVKEKDGNLYALNEHNMKTGIGGDDSRVGLRSAGCGNRAGDCRF